MTTKMTGKQIRTVELRNALVSNDNNEMILEGYAAVFDSPTVLYESPEGVQFKEVIARDAFDGAIMKDCCLKYNHDDGALLLARTRGGSLELTVDNIGLRFKAKLFNTTAAKDVYTLVKEGGIDKCSFSFLCKADSYDTDTHTRTILKFKELYDVSVVDIPAYDNTSVEARKAFSMDIEKVNALDSAEKRKRLELLLKL